MQRDNGGFIEQVLGGAFTIFVVFMMLAFVLWLIVEFPAWVLFVGIVTTMLVINYFRK